MAQDRKYVVINPPGANPAELNNWQVLRAIVDAINNQSLTSIFPNVTFTSTHEDLTDMPSKTNDDHDDRYIIEMEEPTDPVIGKAWLDESEGPLVGSGVGIPAGGSVGQLLTKKSADDFDVDWEDQAESGLSQAQVLMRSYLKC